MPDLELYEEMLGDDRLIVAIGEIDHSTAPRMADALRMATLDGEGRVVLDMTRTRFIDSAGVSTLLNGLRRLTRQHRKLILVCPQGAPRRVFEMAGLVGTFELVETVAEAVG